LSVKLKGRNGLESRRTNQCLEAFRNYDGTWTQLRAIRESDKSQEILYIKLQSTIAKERSSKLLATMLGEQLPARKLFAFKREGALAIEWKAVAVLGYDKQKKRCSTHWDNYKCH
jgi:hypothetical protein